MVTNSNFTINVTESTSYQEMDGFGYTLTGGSAMLINNMSTSSRSELLHDMNANVAIAITKIGFLIFI